MKSTKNVHARPATPAVSVTSSREDKIERLNHLAFYFFMGALLIGFIVVAVSAFLYW